MRVYYPSLDGTPSATAILDLCECFPLVLLVHGDCGGNPYYQWDLMPAQLARCGYVVAVTYGVLSQGQTSDTLKLHQAESWLRTYWEHADRIMAPPNTAVIGHSYGATLAAQLAAEMPLKAFASRSGVFGQVLWETPQTMLSRVQVPSLFCWNDNDDVGVNADMSQSHLWDSVGTAEARRRVHERPSLRLPPAEYAAQVRPEQPARRLLSRSRPRHRFCHHVHREVRAAAVRLLGIYLGTGQPVLRPQDLPAPPQNGFYAGALLSGFAQAQKHPGSQPPPSDTCVEKVLWQTPSIRDSCSWRPRRLRRRRNSPTVPAETPSGGRSRLRPKSSQTLAVPVIVMVVPVAPTTPIPAADVNNWRRGIGWVWLVDHRRWPEVDAEINPRICHRGCGKREDTKNN